MRPYGRKVNIPAYEYQGYKLGYTSKHARFRLKNLTKEALEQHYQDVEDESRELREWLDSILSVD